MAKQAWWCDEARSMIGTPYGISNLATTVLGTARARRFSRSGFVWSSSRRFQPRTVESSGIPMAIDGFPVVPFKEGPRRERLCPAPLKKVPASAASAPRLNSLSCSAGSGQGHSLEHRLASEPNNSINRTPNPLRGFGSLATLGTGYFSRWALGEASIR
jgi:hypothetical protein